MNFRPLLLALRLCLPLVLVPSCAGPSPQGAADEAAAAADDPARALLFPARGVSQGEFRWLEEGPRRYRLRNDWSELALGDLDPYLARGWGIDQVPRQVTGRVLLLGAANDSPGQVTVEFQGVAAPAIEVLVTIEMLRVPLTPASLRGDLTADSCALAPLLDGLPLLIERALPEVETIGLRFEAGAMTTSPERLLGEAHLSRADRWRPRWGPAELDPRWQERRPSSYAPAPGLEGLLPTHGPHPNVFSGQGTNVLLPTRNWSLFLRSHPVQYEFVRDAHDGTRILLHASAGPCPDRPVVYDLVVDPEEFGGREQLVERIVAELEGPGETALSRIIDRYLGLYQHCAQDGGVVAPDTTIRICDVRAPDVPLGAVIFRYLPEPIALLRPDGSSTLSRYARRDHPSLEELRQSEGAQARIAERVRWFEEQAPLSELEGGSYLGALIAGDWEVVTELDRRSFARLAARLDDETLTGLIALLALIQNRPSAAPWYRQIVLEYVAGSSLVSHLAATYLQEYAERYPADCLGSDPPRVVVTRRTQRYLDDGSGAPVPVGPAEEQRSEFAIKPELYDLLAQVAAARPQLAASLDALWVRVEGSLTPRQLSVGVRQLMARFPCDAPEILAFERHLRHLFELDRERTEQFYGELGLR